MTRALHFHSLKTAKTMREMTEEHSLLAAVATRKVVPLPARLVSRSSLDRILRLENTPMRPVTKNSGAAMKLITTKTVHIACKTTRSTAISKSVVTAETEVPPMWRHSETHSRKGPTLSMICK